MISVKKALIISKTKQSTESLAQLLYSEGYKNSSLASSSATAKDFIGKEEYDLILINIPLENETGLDLAIFAATNTQACVVVIVHEQHSADVLEELTKYGILVISRPINKHLFHHYLIFTDCYRNRILGVVQENDKLKNMVEEVKLVNRAKLLLMQCLTMTEKQAHHYLEKQAMDLRISKIQIAKQVIKTYEN